MDIADEIAKLNKLKQEGALTEEEFKKAKADLLAKNSSAGEKLKGTVDGVAKDENMWGMFIHLGQFAGIMIPYAGLVLPIVLWQIKKDESKVIDRHGKIVTNWIISATIYGVVSGILSAFLIGIPMLFAVLICAFVFPIIGAVKANNGEVWEYPICIKFFKLDEPAATAPPAAQSTPEPQKEEQGEPPNPSAQ